MNRLQHRHRRHWFWPRGITGRLVLLMALGLVAAQTITGWLYGRPLREQDHLVLKQFGNRVIQLTHLLKDLPPDQQVRLMAAINHPLLEVRQVEQSPIRNNEQAVPLTLRVRPLNQQLTEALELPYAVEIRDARLINMRRTLTRPRLSSELWPSRQQVVIAVANPSGGWWVFITPLEWHLHRPGSMLIYWVLISGLLLWLLLSWAARRVTAPILQFAAAADRLGMDVNAPPLPERGSMELRQATRAFNQMQARLQRLITDRTLMLAAISHDLRTVLTRLRLRAEFIEDATQQQKAAADLAQMEAMLNATLVFAKEDSTPEARTSLDLASLLQSICDDLSDGGAMAEYQGAERIELWGQSLALRRAFANLIGNATIYGEQATVSAEQDEMGVTVTICDRGPGIPPEQREKVFQPFFRLEPSRNRTTGGTGLGLAVAHTVIRRHGGEIRLCDRNGGGLMVTVTLPSSQERPVSAAATGTTP